MTARITWEEWAAHLQVQAAELAKLAREYRELGPAWRLQAITIQKLAQQHYAMVRANVDYISTRRAMKRAAQFVGKGAR
jgi:hypothetical protein